MKRKGERRRWKKEKKKEKGRGKREHYVRKTTCNIMKITDRANPLFESSYNIMTQWDICTI